MHELPIAGAPLRLCGRKRQVRWIRIQPLRGFGLRAGSKAGLTMFAGRCHHLRPNRAQFDVPAAGQQIAVSLYWARLVASCLGKLSAGGGANPSSFPRLSYPRVEGSPYQG
jgi:hypothetical protein